MDLCRACETGDLDTLKRIMRADPTVQVPINGTFIEPIEIVAFNGHLPCLQLLVEEMHQNPDIALAEAAKSGHLECVTYLIKRGANVNYTASGTKISPLICALSYPSIVLFLIKHGANVNYIQQIDRHQMMTTLEYVLYRPHDEIQQLEESARILLEAGATYDNRTRKLSSVWLLNKLETEMKRKLTHCISNCGALLFCFRRRGGPRDLARHLLTIYVRETWREEEWLK